MMTYSEALNKLTTPKEWDDYYYKKYGSFRVQVFIGRPNKWENYEPINHPKNVWGFPNHRERMVDEIIIDFDGKKPDTQTHGMAGFEKFKERNLECSLWESGGSGYHLHCFFPELKNLSVTERPVMIDVIKKTLLKGLLRPQGLSSHVCESKPILFQTECAQHRKGGSKELSMKHTTESWNRIPPDCWKNYNIQKRKEAKEKEERINNPAKEIDGKPAFIEYFLSENYYKLNEGKKRAAFILASYYGTVQPNREFVISKLREWNSYTLRNGIEDNVLEQVTKSVMQYHANGGIRIPYNYARDLLKELGRQDIYTNNIEDKKEDDTR